jgi:hypothetical protein
MGALTRTRITSFLSPAYATHFGGYVERWLARQEEASEKAARARHDQSMRRSFAICVSVLALLIATLALWRKW